jgi:PTH2 family peptidyl-tRNA hydrolase
MAGGNESIQYYLGAGGLPGADLALLAARAALLAHRRFRARPGYARWLQGSQAKVVLRAEPEEITALASGHDGLCIPEPPDTPQIAVFRPRPKPQAAFVGHLKLFSGRIGPSVRADWPEPGLHVPVVYSADLDLSAGKLAAQAAHAVLVLQDECGRRPVWTEWLAAGMPLALLRAPGETLARLREAGVAFGVEDEGRTQIPAGSLAAVAGPPGSLDRWRAEPDVVLVALGVGRRVD